MNVLLDESVPKALGFRLTGHHVRSVQAMGWSGLENGKLLQAMSAQFDVLITCDQNIDYQQNPNLPVALLVLVAPDNRVSTIVEFVPEILVALGVLQCGQVRRIFHGAGSE